MKHVMKENILTNEKQRKIEEVGEVKTKQIQIGLGLVHLNKVT